MKTRAIRTMVIVLGLLVLLPACRPEERGDGIGSGDLGSGESGGPPNSLDLVLRAEGKIAGGDLTGALTDLDGAVQLSPKFARAHHLRGVALNRLGKTEEALQSFVQVMALDEAYADEGFLREAGEALLASDQAQVALNLLGRASQLSPALLVVSAKAKSALGDGEGARDDLKRALTLAPDLPGAAEFEKDLERFEEKKKNHYLAVPDPERLGEGSMVLEGTATMRLPRGFVLRPTRKGAKARHRTEELSLTLEIRERKGDTTAAWREALEQEARDSGKKVKVSQDAEAAGSKGFLLHVVEPGPESGMFEPFNLVRYVWILDGPKGYVAVVAEGEVGEGQDDLPEELRRDILASLATLTLTGK